MKTTHKVAVPNTVGIPTIIEFLLDETGSMQSVLPQTLGGFKDFIDEQRKLDGLCLLSLTKFDTRGLRNPYVDLDIGMVPYLTTSTFVPDAMTNLNDSIIARIEARRTLLQQWVIKPRVLFVCMTDGADNSSINRPEVVRQQLINATEDGWTFVFLGAYAQSQHAALNLGFLNGNIRSFEGAHMQETMQELAVATKAYRAAESVPTSFYAEKV